MVPGEVNLKKLFLEKKYNELILIIEEKIPEKSKNSALINLLGVCRLLRQKSNKENLLLAIGDFRKAFSKEKKTKSALESLRNFINTSITLHDYQSTPDNFKTSAKLFEEALTFFNEDKDYLSKDEALVIGVIGIYKRLTRIDKIIFYLGELLRQKYFRPLTICSLIYNNCYFDNWSQDKFLEYGKLLDKNLPIYHDTKLISPNKTKKKKMKIGFFSADIKRKHSVSYFLKTVINHYDKNKYEIFLYLNHEPSLDDETTKYFKDRVNKTINLLSLNDVEAINLIRGDRIDVFIDLMGISSESRLALVKNRVAPIQISWCGFCNTTGIQEMDYIIADPNLIYNSEKNLYSEKIIFLPNVWNCHSGINKKRSFNPSPFIKKKEITFGSFNNLNKINDSVIEVWSNILKTVKNSKLILKPSAPRMTYFLSKKFDEKKVLGSIKFEPTTKDFDEHMNTYKKIDIALDTFPFNGVTTSFESIWMGVPVLTLKGYNFNSRCGESINKNLNLEYLIAKDEREYILKAKELAEDNNILLNIRNKIFEDAITSPLFNTKKFSDNFFNSLDLVK
tara:strand:+ start:64 stop:1755 length:1692 start_codon:yes stop_codon:yes gene_type:complete